MSVVQNPIVGRSSGKFSNAIFSKWKSKNTLRSKPLVVHQPNSPAQLTQRSVFALMVSYARSIISELRFSLKYSASDMSEFNAFIKKNMHLVDSDELNMPFPSLRDLVFASGPLPGLADVVLSYVSGLTCPISWDDSYFASERENQDLIQLFFYNFTQNVVSFQDATFLFSNGNDTVNLPGVAADVIYIFAAVKRGDSSSYSPSQYVGTVTIG